MAKAGVNVKVKKRPKRIQKRIQQIQKALQGPPVVRVGLPKESNAYPDGTSVIMVGAVHEFGSPSRGVPERSYLRSTVFENNKEYKEFLGKLARKVVRREITLTQAMNLLGTKVAADVQQKITDISEPPLKHREGNPLVDSGHFRQSITYQVGEGDAN